MDNYNYPMGSDNANAPWNQEDPKAVEIEVTISVTLSKTVKISVTDYSIEEGKDEDGQYFKHIDYSNCDLKEAVKNQITLPQDAYKECLIETDLRRDLEDWIVDDFEVIIE